MIFLLRHGQTEFNVAGKVQGQLDSPLTALGEAQAVAMGRALAAQICGAPITITASPLGRTQHTARIVASALGGPEVNLDPRLAEVAMGQWQGLTRPEIDARWPDHRARAARNMWFFAAPEGESHAKVAARCQSLLDDLKARGGLHVLVSHAITGRVLRGLFAGLAPEKAARLEIPQDAFFRLLPGGETLRIAAN